MTIRNLTPHEVTLVDDGEMIASYEAGGVSARAEQVTVPIDVETDGVVLHETRFGAPIALPAPMAGEYLIVSLPVDQAAHLAGRTIGDLLIPAEPVRDDTGRIVGCRHLARVDLASA